MSGPLPPLPKSTGKQILLVWAVVVTVHIILAAFKGTLGSIGPDSDDVVRLVQIRDLYAGQNWFDLAQYRMGPEGGTLMHWSRLVDFPILFLIWIFDLVLPYAAAEKIAITLWPPLCSVFVIWGVLVGARHMGGEKTAIFAVLLLFFLLFAHQRFMPGAIDHHNLQLGMLALATGYALDPEMRGRNFAIMGIALAISAAIGIEVIFFVVIMCAFVALNWWASGQAAKRGTLGFGAGFAAALLLIFIGTTAPQNYGVIACDAFSLIILSAGLVGGLGLAVLAGTLSERNWMYRGLGLAVLGIVCLAVLAGQAPQCLANPLDSLPPEAKTLWLDHIKEAQPLFADKTKALSLAPYALGPSLLALVIALLRARRKDRPAVHLLLAVLLAAVIALSVYQVRFYFFGAIFSIILLASWVGDIYERTKEKSEQSVVYIFALAAAIPFVWGFPGLMLTPIDDAEVESQVEAEACYSDEVFDAIKTLPAGRFAITSNGTAPLLQFTEHSALSGNYHRNTEGMVANIRIFTRPPQEAYGILKAHNIDYVYMCRTTAESFVLAEHNNAGLMAQLIGGNVPAYLKHIPPDFEGGSVRLFRVVSP